MAGPKSLVNVGIPFDAPVLTRPGVIYREADHIGNAQPLALPAESPERAAKGDLGLSTIKNFESRALTGAGAPFTLKPGKGV